MFSNTVEDEKHILLNCESYDVIHQNVYGNLTLQTEYTSLTNDDKLSSLLNEHLRRRKQNKYIVKPYFCRQNVMYS